MTGKDPVERLAEQLLVAVPKLDPVEQNVGLTLLRMLASVLAVPSPGRRSR